MTATRAEADDERHHREAEVLSPDFPVALRDGRIVTVREIRYGQAITLGRELRPLAQAIADKAAAGELAVRAMLAIPEDFPAEYFRVLAVSTGLSETELAELPEEDGERLEIVFWRVNTAFFARRVSRAFGARADRSVPASSSPSSSDLVTRLPI